MGDRWLEAREAVLQKAFETQPSKPVAAGPILSSTFSDLLVVDSDPNLIDAHPIDMWVAKRWANKFGVPAPSAQAEAHPNGIFVQKLGTATWTNTYLGGELLKSKCEDGSELYFDARASEISKADYLKIKEPAPLFVSERVAKIIGVAPGDQCPEELLLK